MRRCPVLRLFLLFALTVTPLGTADAAAQVAVASRAGPVAALTVGGRFNAQYQASSVGTASNDFFIRRARLIADIEFNDFFGGRVQADFAGGSAELMDAWARLDFDGFELYAGQFKRAFDIFELASSTDLSLIERDGRVGGYSACPGVGSVCSFSRLTESLAFAGRDTGLKIEGESGAIVYQASLTNGRGVGVRDENDGKSVSGRLGYAVDESVVVSGNVAIVDYLDPVDETANAVAWSADVQVGTWRDGLLLQAALAGGENWLSLDAMDEPASFLTFQAVASYYHPLEGDRVIGIEPLARISVADPDDDLGGDGGTLLTPGVMFYLLGKNKIGVNLDYYVPRTGDSVYSVKVQTFLFF
jgi:hypothetical protein